MYPKYSVKELSIGTSMPVKLRLMNLKDKQVGVIKKLTEIFCERVAKKNVLDYRVQLCEKNNKENRSKTNQLRGKTCGSNITRKTSEKFPVMQNRKKDQYEQGFTPCFQHIPKDNKKAMSVLSKDRFTPYRLQEQQNPRKNSRIKLGTMTRKISIRKRSTPQRTTATATQPNQSIHNWQVQKWQTGQESMLPSFIAP